MAESQQQARIEWDRTTLRLVVEHGCYARIVRLDSGVLLCCYQKEAQSWIKRSHDDGKTWTDEQVITAYDNGVAANPEMIHLKNRDLLLCYNERPQDGVSPYTVAVKISHDEGRTWNAPLRIYKGGKKAEEGCWEPAALQFPDGEIQVYFANEAPYSHSKEQEISMVSSTDSGVTWSRAETVSFRPGSRDGMPVPRLLNDGQTVAIAIEDNGINGYLKPAILYSDVENRWKDHVISGTSSKRRFALSKRLADEVYAGAPYIVQMPAGTTLLSVQNDESQRGFARMIVYVGDQKARNFQYPTEPFDVLPGKKGQWNSLFVKNSNTVTAVSSTTLDGIYGVWIIDGTVKGFEAEAVVPEQKEKR